MRLHLRLGMDIVDDSTADTRPSVVAPSSGSDSPSAADCIPTLPHDGLRRISKGQSALTTSIMRTRRLVYAGAYAMQHPQSRFHLPPPLLSSCCSPSFGPGRSFSYLVGCRPGNASSSLIVERASPYTRLSGLCRRFWTHCTLAAGFPLLQQTRLDDPTRPPLIAEILYDCPTHAFYESATYFLCSAPPSAWQHLLNSHGLIMRRYRGLMTILVSLHV